MKRLGHALLLCGLTTLACKHTSGVERQAQADGSYRVDCKRSLTQCLTAIEEVCGSGYDVLQAREQRRVTGPLEPNEPYITSVVVARCWNQAVGAEKPIPPAASDGAAPPASSRSCIPGATQACVGPAACRGGQQCLADGMAFGPCDCGGAAPAEPTVSPAAPDSGAAAPR